MKTMSMIAVGAFALSAATAAAAQDAVDAQDAASPATQETPAPNASAFEMEGINPAVAGYDVAGVRLGMTAQDAFAALEGAGYVRGPVGDYTGTVPGPTFEELTRIVGGELSVASGTGSWREATFTKGDEVVALSFIPLPGGVLVKEAIYEHLGEGMTLERFLDMATAKYGEPRMRDEYYGRWSDMSLIYGDDFDEKNDAVQLVAKAGSARTQNAKVNLTLSGGGFEDLDAEALARDTLAPPAATF